MCEFIIFFFKLKVNHIIEQRNGWKWFSNITLYSSCNYITSSHVIVSHIIRGVHNRAILLKGL